MQLGVMSGFGGEEIGAQVEDIAFAVDVGITALPRLAGQRVSVRNTRTAALEWGPLHLPKLELRVCWLKTLVVGRAALGFFTASL